MHASESATSKSGKANQLAEESALRAERRSELMSILRAFAQDKGALVAAVILAIIIVISLGAPLFAPHNPIAANADMRLWLPGTPGHPLGLDFQGRDMLSRIIWGGRTSIPNAVVPVIIASVISLILGISAGYLGGFIDSLIMRMTDVLIALPSVVLAVAIAAAIGRGSLSVIVATTLIIIAPLTRMTYTATRGERNSEYVVAARSIGVPTGLILGRHLLPNVLAPVLVYSTTIIGFLVVFTASLSFLGLGVAPPNPDWGLMVDEGRRVMAVAPHAATIPGLVIAVTALCFNLVGDGLRYALDPRQRRH
jgi:peptide/nickel transport system permease protein